MERYNILFKSSVAKDLRRFPNDDVKKIIERINKLAQNPRGANCIKLSNIERYRVRQGIYRIIYEIIDSELIVLIVKVGHRSNVYKSS